MPTTLNSTSNSPRSTSTTTRTTQIRRPALKPTPAAADTAAMSHTAPLSERRRAPQGEAGETDGDGTVMRPITNPTAIVLARQLVKAGTPGIELHPDGTFWARGVDRRRRERRAS
jgi:hypothetical protein